MIIIRCFQQIAFVDTETGEFQEQRLAHREEAKKLMLRNGGASRDRTDDLIVANDVVLRYYSLIPQDLQAKHPLGTAIYWNTIRT